MLIAAVIVAGLVLALALLIGALRIEQALSKTRLRDAIVAYVTARDATVTFDDRGMTVKGPLGEGHVSLAALSILCTPDKRATWHTSIGFILRKYIPDAFHEAFAKAAKERLAKASPAIAALSEAELESRLRARICSRRRDREGLATCAEPLGTTLEVRVVLDGFDLDGLPTEARARLPEDDDTLRLRAIDATLPAEVPAVADGTSTEQLWLCRAAQVFGAEPYVIVADGTTLAWIPALPDGAHAALAELARQSLTSGPLTGILFGWDGDELSESHVVNHTILGPTTPDYTLTLAPAILSAMNLDAEPNGQLGVRRTRA